MRNLPRLPSHVLSGSDRNDLGAACCTQNRLVPWASGFQESVVFFTASGGNSGPEGFLSPLSSRTGLAILCAPWEAPALVPSLLEDEKLSQ